LPKSSGELGLGPTGGDPCVFFLFRLARLGTT
jgi:hypothetical protein